MNDFNHYVYNILQALSNLVKVLRKCIEMNLMLSHVKCEFLINAGTVLGHSMFEEGIQVDPNKIFIIKSVPTPQKKRAVRILLEK